MRLCDPHVHMSARTTADYEAMTEAGVVMVIEPASWVGQPRTHVGSVEDYFATLVGWEPFRASQFGVHHFCALGINPREANDRQIASGVLELLPRYLHKDGVVAVGEIGFEHLTTDEEMYFGLQLELARRLGLPALVRLPKHNARRAAARSLALIRDVGIAETDVLLDRNTEETLPIVRRTACWIGHSIASSTSESSPAPGLLDEERVVALIKLHGTERVLVSSGADWSVSDPLKVPRIASRLRAAGVTTGDIEAVLWKNPLDFYARSGRLDRLDVQNRPAMDRQRRWQADTVIRV